MDQGPEDAEQPAAAAGAPSCAERRALAPLTRAAQINKCLKALEQRKLVKAVKSVANGNRKVYMLFELEPSREITGGAWYTGHEYDCEFIDVLRQQCHKYIERSRSATVDMMSDFVRSTGLSRVELSIPDVLQIVNTLVYDGKVDAHESRRDNGMPYAEGTVFYTPAAMPMQLHSHLTSVPCGVCPVAADCHEGGTISPETCTYFRDWTERTGDTAGGADMSW